MTKKIVVIGGNGFLGTHLSRLLLDKYYEADLLILDLSEQSTLTHERLTYVGGIDITSSDITEYIKDADVVFHLAAIMSFGRKNKDILLKINADGAKRVIQQCENVNLKNLVFVSSIGTIAYKDKKIGTEEEGVEFGDSTFNHYGYSKYVGEGYALDAVKNNKIDRLVIACPGIMIGRGDPKTLPLYSLVKRSPILFGPSGSTNYVDVRDVASGLVALYEKGKHGEKYLLTNTNISHSQFFREIATVFDKKRLIMNIPGFIGIGLAYLTGLLEYVLPKSSKASREGLTKAFHKRNYSNAKAERELGWKPEYSIQDTIRYVVEE